MDYAFHSKVIKAFMENIYSKAITVNNIVNDGEEYFSDTLWFIKDEGAIEGEVPDAFRNYVLAYKGNEKYIVPTQFVDKVPFVVTEYRKCYLKKADRKVWHLVTGIKQILLPPKIPNVREFVDNWNPVETTNQNTWTILKLIALSTRYMGSKLCVCSEPGAGKNIHFNIINEITRDTLVIGTPSIAKFETSLFYNKCINLNEMGKPKPDESDGIRDLIIWLGDQSVRYNKRSLAVKREMGSLDIGHISLVMTYNRKRNLKESAVFFDDLFSNPGAIRHRIPQFLFEGNVTEVIRDLSPYEASDLATKHSDKIKEIISGLIGLPEAIKQQKHGYDTSLLHNFTNRQRTNIQGLLDTIDAYCQTEDEFVEFICYLNNAKMMYDDMIKNEVQGSGVDDGRETKTHELKVTKVNALTTIEKDIL